MVLRRVGVLSAGKLMGTISAFMGLIVGGFMVLISLVGATVDFVHDGGSGIPAIFAGVGALIFAPIFYGIMGFVMGVVYAALYNFLAGIVGGLELEFETLTVT